MGLNFKTTSIFEANANAWLSHATPGGKRRALNEGGASSSKTFSILQLLILISTYSKRPLLTSIVSETMPHLKKGALRDFRTLMGDTWDPKRWNATDYIYRFPKATIEFFSADQPGKQRGPRRQILYINEPNNGVSYESFTNLDDRTELFTFMDWNPCGEFWVHEHGMLDYPENQFIHSTYLDAIGVVPQSFINNLLAKKERDPNGWRVFGLGLMGQIEGLIYPFFKQVDAMPTAPAGAFFFGLDFGFTVDPSVLTRHCILGDDLFSEELVYRTNMTNHDIASAMADAGVRKDFDEIWADAAEPKSIHEIHQEGYNIKPCPKGADSVDHGRQKVNQYRQHWTKASTNCIKDQRNFRRVPDKDGKLTEKGAHQFSHGMDSRRYAVVGQTTSGSFSVWSEYLKSKQPAQPAQPEKAVPV